MVRQPAMKIESGAAIVIMYDSHTVVTNSYTYNSYIYIQALIVASLPACMLTLFP